MAGSITVSSIQLDSDNTFRILSNTGSVLVSANGSGLLTGVANTSLSNKTITNPTVSGNLSLDSTGTSGIRLPAANTITFHTSGTEDMRIDANGNVGLGTTTPAAKIAILGGTNQRGQINFGNTAEDGATPLLGSLNNESPAAAVFGWGLYDSNSTGNLVLYRRNDSTTGVKTAEWNRGNGNFSFDSGYGTAAVAYGCRAWVNFNGTGTVAIRASGNVSSITDNAVGNYTVNFSTAMPDVNYSAVATIRNNPGVASGAENIIAMNTGSVQVTSEQTNNFASYDPTFVCVSVFR